MEVINPVIIASGRRQPLPNQAQSEDILRGYAAYDHLGNQVSGTLAPGIATIMEAPMMLGTFSQKVPLFEHGEILPIAAPALYMLRPGDYTLHNHEFDPALLQQYGLERGTFRRLFIGGYLPISGSSTSINFCGVYDKSYDANYTRGYCYINNVFYECSLPLILGEQGKTAIALAALYGLACDANLIPLENTYLSWEQYSSLKLFYMLLEE